MRILVLNSGSSSLRFALYENGGEAPCASGIGERLNTGQASLELKLPDGETTLPIPGADHEQALKAVVSHLREHGALDSAPDAIGHRIVHGGEHFSAPERITPDSIRLIESCNHLAPLHNSSGVLGIRVAQQLFPDTEQTAVFDTSFHQTLPEHAYLYAIPRSFHRDHGVRRYGFHGSSHSYVSERATELLALPADKSRIISAHLGNGCSAAAILNGKSVDTTMGLTPMEGLVMGTRCGDLDPGLVIFLSEQLGMSTAEISNLLNKQSGLLGLSDHSNDMRELRKRSEGGCEQANLAIAIFCFRAAKSIAALTVSLGGLDALIFTGGIGENDHHARSQITAHLAHLGVDLDSSYNSKHGSENRGIITTATSPVAAIVIPTDEERMIARLTEENLTANS